MKKLLILFAKGFPYNFSEPFLENEHPLYRSYFDSVLLVTGCKRGETATRQIGDSFTQVLNDYTLSRDVPSMLAAIPGLLSDRMFWRECGALLRTGFTWRRFYELLTVALCGNHRAAMVLCWLRRHPDYEPEVLYAYWMQIPAYAALRLRDRLGRPGLRAVSRCHGFDVFTHRHPSGYIPFQKQYIQKLDNIAPASRAAVTYLRERYGQCEKIRVQYLGAADQGQTNPYTCRTPLRIVSCARVVSLKRLPRIVDALAKIETIPVEWTHIGGDVGSGGELDALKAYAGKMLSGKPNIRVSFCGAVPNQEIYRIYARQEFHVFLSVSQTEGGAPISICEAMSYGIPVVATAVGGQPETVDVGKTGYLLAEDYADEELAERLLALAEMPEQAYQSMRRQSRARFEAGFCAQRNNRRFIEEVLLRRRVPGEECQQ